MKVVGKDIVQLQATFPIATVKKTTQGKPLSLGDPRNNGGLPGAKRSPCSDAGRVDPGASAPRVQRDADGRMLEKCLRVDDIPFDVS